MRWFIPALFPLLVLVFVYRSDKNREPLWLVGITYAQGILFAGIGFYLQIRATEYGFTLQSSAVGNASALIYLFLVIAPVREMSKVAAAWMAFKTRHFDEPYDGIVYAAAAALGFASCENAVMLYRHPEGKVWLFRAAFALPAHLFFAALWGYALGRARTDKKPGPIFPLSWLGATICHGLYTHLVYGRGPGALVAAGPLLIAMGGVAFLGARDLNKRGDRVSRIPHSTRLSMGPRISLHSIPPPPPSLARVRAALRAGESPLSLRWIFYGAFVTMGAMIVGLGCAVGLGAWAHVDFSLVDEGDVSTTAPVALLGSGVLAAFPVSGYLVARASALRTLLEPALALGAAIMVVLAILGASAPLALIFAVAFAPIAWALGCLGAWLGKAE